MTNTNKAVEVANMMAEEFKIVGASFNRLAEQFETLLAIVLEEKSPVSVVPVTELAKEEKKADKKSGKPVPKSKEAVKEVEPVVEEETEEDGEEEEEALTVEDLQEMSLKELKALADENEIEYPAKVKKPALIELISEAMEGEEEEEEQEEAEEEIGEEEELDSEEESEEEDAEEEEVSTVIETEDGEVDLAEMNVKELKAFAKEYDLEVTAKKKDGLIQEILEQIYAEDEEAEDQEDADEEESEDDGEDLAEQLGLNDMEVEDLAEILAENGLSTKGKKQALIDRIVRGVEDGTIEVGDEEEGE